MIEGLRALPWLQAHRGKMAARGDTTAMDWLDCETCQRMLGPRQRAGWACGYLPESQRRGRSPAPWHGARHRFSPTVCVGFTATLPVVQDAARALEWSRRGLLKEFLGEDVVPPFTFDALDIMASAHNEATAYYLDRGDS